MLNDGYLSGRNLTACSFAAESFKFLSDQPLTVVFVMCLGIPCAVCELKPDDAAIIEIGGIKKETSLALVKDVELAPPRRGDSNPSREPAARRFVFGASDDRD